jgi:hypothetical protein
MRYARLELPPRAKTEAPTIRAPPSSSEEGCSSGWGQWGNRVGAVWSSGSGVGVAGVASSSSSSWLRPRWLRLFPAAPCARTRTEIRSTTHNAPGRGAWRGWPGCGLLACPLPAPLHQLPVAAASSASLCQCCCQQQPAASQAAGSSRQQQQPAATAASGQPAGQPASGRWQWQWQWQ